MTVIDEIKKFFLLNNFDYWEKLNIFRNEKCTIIIHNDYYEIMNTEGGSYYTNSHIIYELIGYLTYNELMNKDYKIVM